MCTENEAEQPHTPKHELQNDLRQKLRQNPRFALLGER